MSDSTLPAEAWRTRQQFKIGLWRQLWQAMYLRWGRCRLDPWEYYYFQVYLDRYSMDEKERFAGWRAEVRLDRAANTGPARELANDKLDFYAALDAQNAPLPKISAVYGTDGRGLPGVAQLSSPAGVADFLRNPDNMPVFIKPVRGTHGSDIYAISGPIADRTKLVLLSGSRIGLRDLVSTLSGHAAGGYLFQELLRTHKAIGRICGDRLTTLRIIVIVTDAGPAILSAVWRIPTGTNVVDNFAVGRTGNIVAGVDLETGRAGLIIQGRGWQNVPVERHPDTGLGLTDFQVPDWDLAKALCLTGAPHFPGLRLQHWDIALTDRGPLILELNVAGGMRTHQVVGQRGIFGRRLEKLVSGTG